MSAQAALAAEVAAVIAAALPQAEQRVKWNAPSFAVAGRDIVTLNLPPRGDAVRVVFHRGAKAVDTKTGVRAMADPRGRLVWATDQRATLTFTDTADLAAAAEWFAALCRTWAGIA